MRLTPYIVFTVVLNLTACATSPIGIANTRHNLMKLELGMSKEEVVRVMGRPYTREAYTGQKGEPLEFLIYLTQYTYEGSIPDSDKTPICLKDGKVIGWGRNFYETVIKHRVEIQQE